MPDIKLTAKEIQLLIDNQREENGIVESQIKGLQEELDYGRERITKLKHLLEEVIESEKEDTVAIYRNSWTLAKKCEYALGELKLISTSKEIAVYIAFYEDLLDNDNVVSLTSKVSATLGPKAAKADTFSRIEMKDGTIYYGLSSWWEGGFLPTQYIPKKNSP